MERERFDGADVMHLFLACAEKLDWARLVRRFGSHWRVLLAHLCLFGFMYPSERNRIPAWIMAGLMGRLDHEMRIAAAHRAHHPGNARLTRAVPGRPGEWGLQGCAADRGQRHDARRHRAMDAGDRRQEMSPPVAVGRDPI